MALESAHTAAALGCQVVVVPRRSSADPRPRHRGLSHHTRTMLRLALAPLVAATAGRARPRPSCGAHEWRRATADLDGFRASGLPARTMGRGLEEDPRSSPPPWRPAASWLPQCAPHELPVRARLRRDPVRGRASFTRPHGTFRHEDGTEVEREWIEHRGAVGVVAHDGEQLFLVRQPREAVGVPDLLEVPAGKLDVEGEAPLETAKRELAEEIGKAAEHWEPLARFYTSPGFTNEEVHLFLATGCRRRAAGGRGGRADRARRRSRWRTSTR